MVGPAGLILGGEVASRALDRIEAKPKAGKGDRVEDPLFVQAIESLLGEVRSMHRDGMSGRGIVPIDSIEFSVACSQMNAKNGAGTASGGCSIAADRVVLIDGAETTLYFRVDTGNRGYVVAAIIQSGTLGATGVAEWSYNGRIIGRSSTMQFWRLLELDRGDVIALRIKNGSGSTQTYDYRVEGYVRRNVEGKLHSV